KAARQLACGPVGSPLGRRAALERARSSGAVGRLRGTAPERTAVSAQVAVFGLAFGLAASSFSRARSSSHLTFFLARRSRWRRRPRASCGVAMAGALPHPGVVVSEDRRVRGAVDVWAQTRQVLPEFSKACSWPRP